MILPQYTFPVTLLRSPTLMLCSQHTDLLPLYHHAIWCDSGPFNFLPFFWDSESPCFFMEKLVMVQSTLPKLSALTFFSLHYFLFPYLLSPYPLFFPLIPFYLFLSKKWFLCHQLVIYITINILESALVPYLYIYHLGVHKMVPSKLEVIEPVKCSIYFWFPWWC